MFLSVSYNYVFKNWSSYSTEAATRGILLKKVFLKISQISQKNPSAGISFW